jgi:hypothetical protein
MSAAVIIGVVLLLLAGLGVGIYFLLNAKKCKDYETQEECKEPCQWDYYGNKCIDEDEDPTPAPANDPSDSSESGSGGSGGSGANYSSAGGYTTFEKTLIKRGKKLSGDLETCKEKCNADMECMGITYRDGACYKITNTDEKAYNDKYTTSIKVPQGYQVSTIGDRTGMLWGKTTKNLAECAEECKNTQLCGGFRYNNGACELLHKDGISETPVLNGNQFFKAKTATAAGPAEAFHIGGYTHRAADAQAECDKYGAELATRDQMEDAWDEGANWCSWGHEVGGMSYPVNTSLVSGCSTTPKLVTHGPTQANVKKGVNCYGVKPGTGSPKVTSFNDSKWSLHE